MHHFHCGMTPLPVVASLVKELVRTKELKMNESNDSKQTLLMLAAVHGQYELVATAINLGADIDYQVCIYGQH